MTSTPDTAAARKARGAFFTPKNLVQYMVEWAVRDSSDSILEPSCGEADFLFAAAERQSSLSATQDDRGRLHGIELHQGSASQAQALLHQAGHHAEIEVADFFTSNLNRSYDVVIGNPPYVRFQAFSGSSRDRSKVAAIAAGTRLTDLASAWASFTIHAAESCTTGGRLALVLPAELMTVNYASTVRTYILDRFKSVRLVTFTERVFPGVMAEVVLLLADGFRQGPAGGYELLKARDASATSLQRAESTWWTPPAAGDKWTASLITQRAGGAYAEVVSSDAFTTLLDWGETSLGMVTGNNSFFTLSKTSAAEYGFPQDDLLVISPPGSRHLRRLTFDAEDLARAEHDGAATCLFRPRHEELSAEARRYVTVGEERGVQDAYKCRVRKPWWRVPLVAAPDLFLTYMNSEAPSLCANPLGLRSLNSVHGVYLRAELRALGMRTLPLAALNSITLLSAELTGRSYGGGLLKVEPKEADLLAVPAAATLAQSEERLGKVWPEVRQALSTPSGFNLAVKIVDEVLLATEVGVENDTLRTIAEARETLRQRRLARGRAAKA